MTSNADARAATGGGALTIDLVDLRAGARLFPGAAERLVGTLFSIAQMDDLLWASDGDLVTDCAISTAAGRASFPRRAGATVRDWAVDAFAAGGSVLIERLHRRVPGVARFAAWLGEHLDTETDISAVLTPAGASAFPWHSDADDVLVIQLEGCKQWYWHPSLTDVPAGVEVFQNAALTENVHECVLVAGDVLHLPRGTVHRAQACTETSLQLTVALRHYRWLDLLLDLLAAVAVSDVRLRRRADDFSLRERGAALRDRIADALPQALELRAWQRASDAWPMPGELLPAVHQDVGLGTRLRPPHGSRYHVRRVGDRIAFDYAGHRVASLRAPVHTERTLRRIAAMRGDFRVADLGAELTEEELCLLARRLLRDGALERVP